uniref:Uncharacterized protein n=1 Tax=Davidia involucrata TaxID=16924 RepID=A0A5B7ABT7_DAVIN
MEISLIADTVTVAASRGLGFAKFLLPRHDFTSNKHLSLCDSSSEQPSSAGVRQISSVIFPVDTVAPPPVKLNYLVVPRRLVRKTRRTRRKSLTGGGAEDGEDGGFFGDAGDDGPFGGGSGSGGGGRGWNFDRFGGSNWDESSSPWSSDPAFDFVYEVISWIALSNCLHFAFKKVLRIVADGTSDPAREKPIC